MLINVKYLSENNNVKMSQSDILSNNDSIVACLDNDVSLSRTMLPCEHCSKQFKFQSSLNKHLHKFHQIVIQFNCDICLMTFSNHKESVIHRNVHKDDEGKFSCLYCDKKICNFNSFVKHLNSHRKYENNLLNCKKCGKEFDNDDQLNSHNMLDSFKCSDKSAKKTFSCDTCGKTFQFACLLRDHINLHTGLKPYLCQKCGKDFSQKASLKQHVRTHKEVHPFTCDICMKGFYTRGDLKKHERIHTKERPYVCEICGEGFSQSSHLTTHRRSHTHERPHSCDFCPRKFSLRGDLTRHKRIHTGDLPYLCQVCGKKFRQSYQCQNHARTHHSAVEPNQSESTPLALDSQPDQTSSHHYSSSHPPHHQQSQATFKHLNTVDTNFTNHQFNLNSFSHYSSVRDDSNANFDNSVDYSNNSQPDMMYEYYNSMTKDRIDYEPSECNTILEPCHSVNSHSIVDNVCQQQKDFNLEVNRALY